MAERLGRVRLRILAAPMILAASIMAPRGAGAQAPSNGDARLTAKLGSIDLDVFAYRPSDCTPRGIMIVFHGYARDAQTYRDDARPLAQQLCAFVFAPLFDAARFPASAYQRGGVTADRAGIADAPVSLVPGLIDWARAQAGPLPVVLIGHSAGGQFLSRVAAYVPNTAREMIISDPSSYVLPDTTTPPPYGGGFIPPDPRWLPAYLARPVTLILGGADTQDTHRLVTTGPAGAQGANRLTRGENTYAMAQTAARAYRLALNWRMVVVPGLGHDASAFFATAALEARLRAVFRRQG